MSGLVSAINDLHAVDLMTPGAFALTLDTMVTMPMEARASTTTALQSDSLFLAEAGDYVVTWSADCSNGQSGCYYIFELEIFVAGGYSMGTTTRRVYGEHENCGRAMMAIKCFTFPINTEVRFRAGTYKNSGFGAQIDRASVEAVRLR